MNVLIILREKELENSELLIYSLYKNQSPFFNLYIINEDVPESLLQEFFFFCFLLKINPLVLNVGNVILKTNSFSFWDSIFPYLPPDLSRILFLNNNILALHEFSSFYNQDFRDKTFVGCDTKNIKYTEKFQVIQENKELDFDVILFNKENYKNNNLVSWNSSLLYNLDLENPFLLQNPFFCKRLQKKACLIKCPLKNEIRDFYKKQLFSFLKEIQEKKFLGNYPCYSCKYNCSLQYRPIFNSQNIIVSITEVLVACAKKAPMLCVSNKKGYKILYSQPSPKECEYFEKHFSLTKDIEDYLEKRRKNFGRLPK